MTRPALSEEEIFQVARRIEGRDARAAYLEQVCADDLALREQVDALLAAHDDSHSFLESPHAAIAVGSPTLDQPITEKPGTRIGPYKLLQQIGEGGMGTVFMAEQNEPVERRVALKVIKPGMDSRQVIARFEAERQALAMMDHPNVAKVLDAGTTDSGRPYFVMELVKGQPITQYCDEHHLTPRERLELFLPVCRAIQHAHQKGIIHRDIKPTNILVAEFDEKSVPKVIDFGVAKAVGQSLTEKTMFTGFGQLVGTLEYMSPEQAKVNQLDIDTRSDVYSLGVLLYELLTGSTPLDRQRLRSAAWDEMLRIIREEEPEKPSTRLSQSNAPAPRVRPDSPNESPTLASVAALRNTEPARLSKLVRGELDWIVMKALEKDRNRRYETASGFARDIEHYLNDEPVLACPPSLGYRFRKFTRRNKVALATTTAVCVALVAGMIGTTWQAIRATHEATRATNAEALAELRYDAEKISREQADKARAAESRQRRIAQDETRRAEENFDKARRAVDEYLTQVTESELLTVPGMQPLRGDLLEAALKFYAEFTQERADDPTIQRELASAHFRLGRIHSELGDKVSSRAANNEAIRLFEQLRDGGHFDRKMQVALAWAYLYSGRYEDVISLGQNLLNAEPENVEAASLLADTYITLAVENRYDLAAALHYYQQAFELQEALVSRAPDNLRYLAQLGCTLGCLGVILKDRGNLDQALTMYERANEYFRQAYEREPHSLSWGRLLCIGLGNLAEVQAMLGREQEALATYQRLVDVSRKRTFENPAVPSLQGLRCVALMSLARYQQQLGDTGEADRSFREAREVLDNIPRETPDHLYELAKVYAVLAQPVERASGPTEAEVAEQERNIELTMQTLHNAIDAGFKSAQALRSNQEFDRLRGRNDFQQLVTSLERVTEAQRLAESTPPQMREPHTAIEPAQLTVNRAPNTAQFWYALGVAQYSDGKFEDALSALQKYRELAAAGATGPDDFAFWHKFGIAHYRTGNWEEAIAALERSCSLETATNGEGNASQWLFLAMAHWQLGNQEQARKWYEQSLEVEHVWTKELLSYRIEAGNLIGVISAHEQASLRLEGLPHDEHWNSARMRLCREIAGEAELFDAVQQLRPDDADLSIARGQFLAYREKWDEAAEWFGRVIEQRGQSEDACQAACLHLLTGRPDAYRQFCTKLIGQAGEVTDPNVAFVLARTCTLIPEMTASPEQVVSWAEQAVSRERSPWGLHVLGAACCRAGQYSRAIELLEESTASNWGFEGKALNDLVLSIAHMQQGNSKAAADCLGRARALMARAYYPPPPDWLEYHVLVREVEALIEARPNQAITSPKANPPEDVPETETTPDD